MKGVSRLCPTHDPPAAVLVLVTRTQGQDDGHQCTGLGYREDEQQINCFVGTVELWKLIKILISNFYILTLYPLVCCVQVPGKNAASSISIKGSNKTTLFKRKCSMFNPVLGGGEEEACKLDQLYWATFCTEFCTDVSLSPCQYVKMSRSWHLELIWVGVGTQSWGTVTCYICLGPPLNIIIYMIIPNSHTSSLKRIGFIHAKDLWILYWSRRIVLDDPCKVSM